jgi:hypothetical protein
VPEQPSPPEQSKKSKAPLIIGIAAGAAVLIALALFGTFAGGAKDEKSAAGGASASAPVSDSAAATPPTTDQSATPGADTGAGSGISAGPGTAPAVVTMPDLRGANAANAREQLGKLGLTKIRYESRDKDTNKVLLPAEWTVLEQSPKAGEKISTDSVLVLACSRRV